MAAANRLGALSTSALWCPSSNPQPRNTSFYFNNKTVAIPNSRTLEDEKIKEIPQPGPIIPTAIVYLFTNGMIF